MNVQRFIHLIFDKSAKSIHGRKETFFFEKMVLDKPDVYKYKNEIAHLKT